MTASATALIAVMTHANLVSCRHWIVFSARAFEQARSGMQGVIDACVASQLAAIRMSAAWAAAATRRSRERRYAEPWEEGAPFAGHPAMTCFVAEYANDMDPSAFATGRVRA